jgi:DNA repair protein RadC
MNELIAAEIKITYKPQVKAADRPKIQRSADADHQVRAFFDQSMINIKEEAVVLFLNRSNRVIGGFRISSGGITSTVIDISLILGIALKCLAKGLILAHNHPSGELQPSRADQEITTRLKDAARILDITLLEHLILTEDSYLSFADEGLL